MENLQGMAFIIDTSVFGSAAAQMSTTQDM